MIRRLRWKFIIIAMCSLVLVLTLIMTAINVLSYHNMVDRADRTLDNISQNHGRLPVAPTHPSFPGFNHFHEKIMEVPYESRFFSVTFSKKGDEVSVITDNITAVDKENALKMVGYVLEENEERGFLGSYRYLVDENETHVRVILLDCTGVLTANRNFRVISISISAVGLVIVFLLLFFLSKLVTKPVSESIEKQKRFITDAGHELKTPITVIDADAELIEMENGESEWVTDIKGQTKRLAALTNDLILLSRMEEESFVLPHIEFPISDVVQDRASSFTSIYKKNDKNLDICIEKMLTVKGDEKAISQLVSILLDNAVKYSAEGDTVSLTLKRQGKSVVLSVSNSAENITAEQCDRLFDRFWRGDKSRSGGGYGLGLSVARAIVLSHKGKISASVNQDGRLEITAVLPVRD